MNILNNLKIRHKLLLLLLFLFVPLVFFVAIYNLDIHKENTVLQNTYEKLQETRLIIELIHQIQDERALTAGYIRSRKALFGSRLDAIIGLTDKAHAELADYMRDNEIPFHEVSLYYDLQNFRKHLRDENIDVNDYEAFFSFYREQLMKRVNINKSAITDRLLISTLDAQVYLINAKQQLGRLRTLFNFQGEVPNKADIALIIDFTALYQLNIENFLKSASQDLTGKYFSILTGDIVEVYNLLDAIKKNPSTDLSDYDKLEWHEKFSASMNKLKEVEDYTMNFAELTIHNLVNLKKRQMIISSGLTFLLVTVTLLIALYIISFITRNIENLRLASENLSKGITDIKLKITSKDEFGSLTKSFLKMSDRNAELSAVAENIGRGNYDIMIEPRSREDILGNAIISMKKNLKSLSEENKQRTWLLNGISLINDKISGGRDIKTISKILIDQICTYISCEAGVLFYANDDNKFVFSAGYGIKEKNFLNTSFEAGENIAGEVVIQKKIRILDEVKPENLNFKTALSDTRPASILIAPFMYSNDVTGIIELASGKKFTGLEIEFIKEISEKVGIVFQTIRAGEQTRMLLLETQNQAEELEMQQEELRKTNDELISQTESLQASEEELKMGQEELHEKNLELERQNTLLEEARKAIEQKIQEVETVNKYKTDFLANMSHELRTPLNSIMILSKLLNEELTKLNLKKQSEQSQVIYNSGVDLLKMVNEILDLSKIESGRFELEIKETDVKKLSDQKEFDQIAQEKKITFIKHISRDAPSKIYTDEFRLRQILKNILSNAFKFTIQGTVSFKIYAVKKSVQYESPTLQLLKDIIAFEISDTGVGIPLNQQNLIFDAFKQADASTTRKYGGTGLGLSISKELAHALGGEIQLESEEKKGSRFTLFLPVKSPLYRSKTGTQNKSPEEHKITDIIIDQPNKSSLKNILIVEDDRAFNNILSDFIRNKGFTVWQAFSGSEGMSLLSEKPDAVILDITLPDIAGWEILKKIRSNSVLREIPVHVMSAYDVDNKKKHLYNEFIPKPVTLEKLNKALTYISSGKNTIKRVLIIEDNKTENDAISQLLISAGLQPIQAFNGQDAIGQLDKNDPDAIILDLMLPDSPGYDLMKKIRAKSKGSDIPIIIYTGKDISRSEEQQLRKYANTIIIKNEYSYQRLRDEIKLFLESVNHKMGPGIVFYPSEILRDKKALLVDDDIRNIYSIYNFLEREGMSIDVANNGKEALEILEKKEFDVVLMDIMMPEMDGIECTMKIRQNKKFRNLPVIALTAKAMKEDKEKCLNAGASDYISKPVDIQKLITLIRMWVYDRIIKNQHN